MGQTQRDFPIHSTAENLERDDEERKLSNVGS